ncbi:MAG: hypothetical protein LBD03_07025 [Methanobrevibacter sp.]|jgi:hypothetical protein|nr:hypothetical protein [Candidatus Methanovirga procula]
MILLFLSADFGTPIAAEYSKPSFKEILTDTLDVPLNGAVNSSLIGNLDLDNSSNSTDNNSVVFNRIIQFNPNATIGEVIACNMMFEEQLNKTNTDFDLSLYTAYLNNSSSYPISGLNLTARELYNQAPGVPAFNEEKTVGSIVEELVKRGFFYC